MGLFLSLAPSSFSLVVSFPKFSSPSRWWHGLLNSSAFLSKCLFLFLLLYWIIDRISGYKTVSSLLFSLSLVIIWFYCFFLCIVDKKYVTALLLYKSCISLLVYRDFFSWFMQSKVYHSITQCGFVYIYLVWAHCTSSTWRWGILKSSTLFLNISFIEYLWITTSKLYIIWPVQIKFYWDKPHPLCTQCV